jgi:hypothetical protein
MFERIPRSIWVALAATLALWATDVRAESETTPKRAAMHAQRSELNRQRVTHGARQAVADRVKARRAAAASRKAAAAEVTPQATTGKAR